MNLTYKLNSGYSIPLIGLGTFQIHGAELIYQVLDNALSAGYRHFDTAVVYRNEHHIGTALQTLLPKYKLKREDIFLTSKLIAQANQKDNFVEELIKTSLKNLQTDYIDLYLIHWPGVSGIPVGHPENIKYRKNTWKIFCQLHKEGLCRSIGVSNYTIRHINELLADSNGVKPAVNQVEWHPHYHQPDLLKLCQDENIFLQAYSSLGSSNYNNLRVDPTVVGVAKSLGKSASQVLLRWAIQQNIGIIPKASSKPHIDENIDLDFTIPEAEMSTLSEMSLTEKYAWNPNTVI